jgi:hypothetical protein
MRSPLHSSLVQYGGSSAAEQIPLDTGRPSVVIPVLIS